MFKTVSGISDSQVKNCWLLRPGTGPRGKTPRRDSDCTISLVGGGAEWAELTSLEEQAQGCSWTT